MLLLVNAGIKSLSHYIQIINIILAQPMRPVKYRKDKTPMFINKLHKILQDSQNQNIVNWTQDCNGFIILDLRKFTEEVLPKYFKHGNYHSFVRQLNMYNFNKMRYTVDGIVFDHAYQHQLFLKDNQQNFRNIRRKQAPIKCQTLMQYGHVSESEQESGQGAGAEHQQTVFQRLRDVKEKQQKLQQICFQLISQNQMLLAQNQELAHKVKKQSRKKQKVLEQVFRIVGVSIAEFWEEFCQDTQTLQQKTDNFQQIYQMLMNFIDKNDLSEILKTLEFFIAPKSKTKIFKVVNSDEQINFLNTYSQEEVEEFINKTNLILENKNVSFQ